MVSIQINGINVNMNKINNLKIHPPVIFLKKKYFLTKSGYE